MMRAWACTLSSSIELCRVYAFAVIPGCRSFTVMIVILAGEKHFSYERGFTAQSYEGWTNSTNHVRLGLQTLSSSMELYRMFAFAVIPGCRSFMVIIVTLAGEKHLSYERGFTAQSYEGWTDSTNHLRLGLQTLSSSIELCRMCAFAVIPGCRSFIVIIVTLAGEKHRSYERRFTEQSCEGWTNSTNHLRLGLQTLSSSIELCRMSAFAVIPGCKSLLRSW